MIAHCELMGDRVAILDAPPGLNAQQVKEWRVDKAGYDSQVRDALLAVDQGLRPVAGQDDPVPPSGHMAGIWARNDDTRGVHKAPANEVIRGAISPRDSTSPRASTTSSTRTGSTASARSPAAASASGARARSRATRRGATSTSAGCSTTSRSRSSRAPSGSSSSRTTIDSGAAVKRTINAFLLGVWRDGALFGATPDQAFFVKCDEENNPPESCDAGQLDRRDRHRAGEAGRVRRLPHRPVLGRRDGHRVTRRRGACHSETDARRPRRPRQRRSRSTASAWSRSSQRAVRRQHPSSR